MCRGRFIFKCGRMTKLPVLQNRSLPTTIKRLVFERIVGHEKLKAYKAKLRAVELAGATEAKDAALEDTQDLADYMADVEVRLGELLKPLADPTASRAGRRQLPEGISHKVSHQAQTLAAHKERVEQEKASAREAKTVVTPDKIYQKIKAEENMEKRRARLAAEARAEAADRARIIEAPCLSVLPRIEPIDLLIADPPYFTHGNYTEQVSSCLAVVKSSGQAYVFMGADPEELSAYLSIPRHHMGAPQVLVWNYNNTGQRQPPTRYNSNFQLIFYYRGPDAPTINSPGDGTHQYACQTINAPDGRIGDRYHEWQKPMELLERLIRNSSKAGDFVFDPFAGTGTTMLAAAKLGRKTLGCDIDPAAIAICLERGCVRDV